MKYAFIDLETTGVKYWEHGIWNIGLILDVDGKTVAKQDLKVCPFPQDALDLKALELGNIIEKGGTIEEGEAKLATYADPRSVFLQLTKTLTIYVDRFNKADKFFFVGYNAQFDNQFLRAFWDKNNDKYFGGLFHFPPLDVMTACGFVLRSKRTSMPNFQLATVYKEITGKELVGAHEALQDISATRELFYLIEDRIVLNAPS